MIAITGANGKLGRLVIEGLLKKIPPTQIVATVREPEKVDDLRQLGVEVRKADYDLPETLTNSFRGIEKFLLISAVVPGQRLKQHKAVIDAAKNAGVQLVAFTSMLRADTSSIILAGEHKHTEEYLKASGLQFVLLRNGWYLENNTEALAPALANGAIIGSAGQGRFASASRADYAGAAVAILTEPGHENKTYELAGDRSFSMAEFANEVSKQVGRTIVYNNLSPSAYEAALLNFGVPQMLVNVVVDADVKASKGELDSSSRDLSQLLGRSTTPYSEAIRAALRTD